MDTGRKILNLRCDRKISQQNLARACGITPSALSKIEAGINSPRASIIWRIAQNLGVTVEYLLDERIPYPFQPIGYRRELFEQDIDPSDRVVLEVTREEGLFMEALRRIHPAAREICYSIPEAPVEILRLIHFLIHHSRIQNHDPAFRERFEALVTTGSSPPASAPTRAKKSGRHRHPVDSSSPRAKGRSQRPSSRHGQTPTGSRSARQPAKKRSTRSRRPKR